jgi:hypothetical protein
MAVPPAIPSNEGPTTELFVYQEDLTSIAGLTRRKLIEWLMNRSGLPLDRHDMQVDTEKVLYSALMGASVTMPARVMVRVATRGPDAPLATDPN